METIILCKECREVLTKRRNTYVCNKCSKIFPIMDGIVLMEEKGGKDLRIGDDLLDIYEFKTRRKFYGSFIKSAVDFYGRLHSLDFPNFHEELLSPYLSDSVVVDMGCGQIPYINIFSSGIKMYYGLDLCRKSMSLGRKNFKREFPLILIQHGIENVPFPKNFADVVVSSEVIEHLDRPKAYLQEIHRICKKGSYLSISTPCASMYFYPHNLLAFLKNPIKWYKKVNAHKYWDEALSWHPALRPKVLKEWLRQAGFDIIRHETRLWYYGTPFRLFWRFFFFLEKIGVTSAGNIFDRCLKFTDKILALNIPFIRWGGIRQFVLCKKR